VLLTNRKSFTFFPSVIFENLTRTSVLRKEAQTKTWPKRLSRSHPTYLPTSWYITMAEAAGDGGGGDKLILRGLQFHGFHGVKREERTLGQKFVVDVDAWMDLAAAGESDSIAHTVSYTDIYRLVSDSKICSEFFTIHFFCYAWSKWTW
jgi:hypothetical protein